VDILKKLNELSVKVKSQQRQIEELKKIFISPYTLLSNQNENVTPPKFVTHA
jgi:hypothetical protein